jgi:hypothetical protein
LSISCFHDIGDYLSITPCLVHPRPFRRGGIEDAKFY